MKNINVDKLSNSYLIQNMYKYSIKYSIISHLEVQLHSQIGVLWISSTLNMDMFKYDI